MTKRPKVSILVPIYNVEKYLEQALNSLCNQTLKDIEIICINDGSTDNSLKIIKQFMKKDKRIVLINKKNSGYGDSMNKGLKKATGEYIGILEPDDFVELDAFKNLYDLAKSNGAEIAKANYFYNKNDRDSKHFAINKYSTGRIINPRSRLWIFFMQPAIWSMIYKREFLIKNNIDFLPTPGASYQDTSFNFKCWATAKRVIFTNQAYIHYRLDNETSSVNNTGKVFAVCKEYSEIENYLKKHGLYENYRKILPPVKFNAYLWNMKRIAPEFLDDFIDVVQQEFSAAEQEGSLIEGYFQDKNRYRFVRQIINQPSKTTRRFILKEKRREERRKKRQENKIKFLRKFSTRYQRQEELHGLIKDVFAQLEIAKDRKEQK